MSKRIMKKKPPMKTVNPLIGKKVAITGTLSKTRIEIAADLRAMGAQPQMRITSDTQYLIIGANPGRDKLTLAKKWGVQMMGQSEYEAIWNNGVLSQADIEPISIAELPEEYGGW